MKRFKTSKKEKKELNLGSSVVLDLCQVLKDTYCHVFFDNLFNSPSLIQNLHDNGLYGLCTTCSDRINMPQIKKDKKMKRVDYQCKFYNHIACVKLYDNKSVMLLGSHLEEITSISTMERRIKGSSTNILVNYPNWMKLYNSKMGEVDLMDQLKSAYQLDQRSKFQFFKDQSFLICSILLLSILLQCIRNWSNSKRV